MPTIFELQQEKPYVNIQTHRIKVLDDWATPLVFTWNQPEWNVLSENIPI